MASSEIENSFLQTLGTAYLNALFIIFIMVFVAKVQNEKLSLYSLVLRKLDP